MISYADVEKLRGMRAPGPVLLSLYLPVPLDPAGLRGLAARAKDLLMSVSAVGPDGMTPAGVSRADRDAVLDTLAAQGREWLGHTVAVFGCTEMGLFETLPVPCALPERAVLAARPHVRPLLAAIQRCPDYLVAIVDRRHAWVLSVSGIRVETVARQSEEGPRSPRFGGWYGLQTHRTQQRIIQLGRHHYREVAAILGRRDGTGRHGPLVIGGHHDGIASLLRELPPTVRDSFAGSFTADPHTLTPARIRELAGPVIDGWVARRERELAGEILGGLAAVGLHASLTAVNEGAVGQLLVAREDMIAGYVCGRCGGLSSGSDECPDWGTAACAVPDLLEEMVQRTLDDNGQVVVIRDAPFSVAAKLRFLVKAGYQRGAQVELRRAVRPYRFRSCLIEASGTRVAWAPEFLEFPAWAADTDLMFAEAADWARPIRFAKGAGGHAPALEVAEQAVRHGVRRLVFAHIGRPTITALDTGHVPAFGEIGTEGPTYTVAHGK